MKSTLEFKLEKIIGIEKHAGKVRKVFLSSKLDMLVIGLFIPLSYPYITEQQL